jgi:hypothetical protein
MTLAQAAAKSWTRPLRARIEQVDEEVIGQDARPIGDTPFRPAAIGAEHPQAADEHRQFRPVSRSSCALSISASSGAMNCGPVLR